MKTPKTNSNQKAKAAAKSVVEGYHAGNTLEDKLLRSQVQFHMMILMITSPWWLATKEDMRAHLVDHMVSV